MVRDALAGTLAVLIEAYLLMVYHTVHIVPGPETYQSTHEYMKHQQQARNPEDSTSVEVIVYL